jgi:hypothetical protein
MKYLYLDNLRGFNDAIVPIKDVNFLVGENSTGKTTILNLYYLLNRIEFWSNPFFNDLNIKFGPFNEIINLKSENQKTFSIGHIERTTLRKNSKFDFILLTFKEHNQSPTLSRINFLSDELELGISVSKPQIEGEIQNPRERMANYYYKTIPKINFSEETIKLKIKEWNEEKQEFNKTIKRMDWRYNLRGLFYDVFSNENISFSKVRKFQAVSMPFFDMAYIAPIRSKPKRTYDEYRVDFTPEGEHTPYLLRNIWKNGDLKRSKELHVSINKFGKNSGLFDKLNLKPYTREIGSPFTVIVNLYGKNFKIINTGYGVSQSLPIIVELLSRPPGTIFNIQQPEVHLHPRAQATLGGLIYDLAANQDQKFLIETHSDFIIDRYRLSCKKDVKNQRTAQILFFEKTKNGNKITPISIKNTGQYEDDQPKGFRDFFIKEDLALLGI